MAGVDEMGRRRESEGLMFVGLMLEGFVRIMRDSHESGSFDLFMVFFFSF